VGPPGRAAEGGVQGGGSEAPALVASLDDVAMMREPIEESGRHLGIAPFGEGEIGGEDDGGALVEAADHTEQQLASGLSEGQ